MTMKRLSALLLMPCLAFAANTETGSLDWLAGCWTTPDQSAQEVWVIEDEDLLLGFSVNIRDNKVGFFELMSIRRAADNNWVLTAYPAGPAPGTFTASQIGKQSVIFSNPEHDYPQQIMYRRDGAKLLATISLLGGANPTNFDNVACE